MFNISRLYCKWMRGSCYTINAFWWTAFKEKNIYSSYFSFRYFDVVKLLRIFHMHWMCKILKKKCIFRNMLEILNQELLSLRILVILKLLFDFVLRVCCPLWRARWDFVSILPNDNSVCDHIKLLLRQIC